MDTNTIIHFGLFGSQAKIFSGLYNVQCAEPYDSDADLLLIVGSKNNTTELKSNLQISFRRSVQNCFGVMMMIIFIISEMDLRLILRFTKKVPTTIHKIFFWAFQCSLFYHTIFSNDGDSLSNLLMMPPRSLPLEDRKGIFLRSRKGIAVFITRLSGTNNALIDLRRIISLALRNLV